MRTAIRLLAGWLLAALLLLAHAGCSRPGRTGTGAGACGSAAWRWLTGWSTTCKVVNRRLRG
jgi:hypothetical protein